MNGKREALKSLEEMCGHVLPWLANLYDSSTGGFYMSISGRDDHLMKPAMEMTAYGLKLTRVYTDLYDNMPGSLKERFVKYFTDRQRKDTGYFVDDQGAVNSRETARTQAAAVRALNDLGAQPLWPLPGEEREETVLPDFMNSTDDFISFISNLDWQNDAWTSGDQTWQTILYVNMLPKEKRKEYLDLLKKWIEENQDHETGLWGTPNPNYNTISGAFKIGLVCDACGWKLPRAERILESVFACYRDDKPTVACYVRNALSLLLQLAGYSRQMREKAKELMEEYLCSVVGDIRRLHCPDGGFSKNIYQSMIDYGGVTGSHGLWEGDIDSTVMILTGRKAIYDLLDEREPVLTMEGFWEILSGNMGRPDPYYDPQLLNYTQGKPWTFEEYREGREFIGSELRGNIPLGTLRGIVVKDEERNRKVLSLKADGTQDTPVIFKMFMDDTAATYSFASQHAIKMSFDFKADGFDQENNFFAEYGYIPGYVLKFGGKAEQTVSVVGDAHYNTIEDIGRVLKNRWNNLSIIWRRNPSNGKVKTKVFLNGSCISENDYYVGCLKEGSVPPDVTKELRIGVFPKTKGEIRIDNLGMNWEQTEE